LVAVRIVDIEVAHAVGVILRFREDLGALGFELIEDGVGIVGEDVDRGMPGSSRGLRGGLKMLSLSTPA